MAVHVLETVYLLKNKGFPLSKTPLYKTANRFSLCPHIKEKSVSSQALREKCISFVTKPSPNELGDKVEA